jgi:hypothetical protein
MSSAIDGTQSKMKVAGETLVGEVTSSITGNPKTFEAVQKTAVADLDGKLPGIVQGGRQDMNAILKGFEHKVYLAHLEQTRTGAMGNPANAIAEKKSGEWLGELFFHKQKSVAAEVCAKLSDLGMNENVLAAAEAALDEKKPGDGAPAAGDSAGEDPTITALQAQIGNLGGQISALKEQKKQIADKREKDLEVSTEATYKAVVLTHKLDLETSGKVIADAEFERLKQRQKRLNAINDRNDLLICYHVSRDKEANLDELKEAVNATKQATDAQTTELNARKKTLQEGQGKGGELGSQLGQMLGPFEKFLVELVSKFMGGGVTGHLGTKEGGAGDEAPGASQGQGPAGTLDDLANNKEQFSAGPKTAMADTTAGFATVGQEQTKADQGIASAANARTEAVGVFQADIDENLMQQVQILQGMKQMDANIAEATAGEDQAQGTYDAGAAQMGGVADGMNTDKDAAVAAINVVGDDKAAEKNAQDQIDPLEKERKALQDQLFAKVMVASASDPMMMP